MRFKWEKLGPLIKPTEDIKWMVSHIGASFAVKREDNLFDLYITGRNKDNISSIGKGILEVGSNPKIVSIEKEPILTKGKLGTFDENGVSYPSIVKTKNSIYLYYTGWMPTVNTPFQNQLGLAIINDGKVRRFSRAPLLERDKNDFLSIGSVYVAKNQTKWEMWYTSFLKWEMLKKHKVKHYYLIKYASSTDGINWIRKNKIAIPFKNSSEYAISRPTIFQHNNFYHMFFCARGDQYKLGYAFSEDGKNWKRDDSNVGIILSKNGWDSEEMCYPHVFKKADHLFLLYSGNNYGNSGLGIARMKI